MKLPPRIPFAFSLSCLLACACAALAAAPAPAPTREQQIADLEKQILDLQKKLEEMRKAPSEQPGTQGALPADWVKEFQWRCIGPAAMGGRVVAISAYNADPATYWVATASGGLLKTTNNGVTFEHQFDHESTVSIGDVCVAPSDPNVVWVGTGEANPRNSVSWGDGVYKSVDGGQHWQNMGLKKSFQIGKIVVHPKDPNIVYVGALGRLYGPNEERGLFKTTDGGKTWQKVFYLDDHTGIIDIAMNPADPETLLVAAWERQRDGFDSHRGEPPVVDGYDAYDPIKKWGKAGGIYKTTDGGKNFHKLEHGLPTSPTGRIGLDYYRKDPKEVFAVIDCEKIGMSRVLPYLGIDAEDKPDGAHVKLVSEKSPAEQGGLKVGDVIKTADKKEVKTYDAFLDVLFAHKVGDQFALQVQRDKETKDLTITLGTRPEPPPQVFLGVQGENTEGKGARLTLVAADGPAAKAGLLAGDVVQAIDKKEIKGFEEFVKEVRAHKVGDKVALQLLRGKETKEIGLTLEGRNPAPPSTRPYSFFYSGQRENVQREQGPEGFEFGGVYKSTDNGDTWVRINSVNPRPMYFSQIRVDPSDDKYLYVLGISLYRSSDGGKTFKGDGDNGVHPDQHALWIDPKDGRHMLVGCDGGFYATYDRMNHWDFLNTSAIGQFYHVAVDSKQPYNVYGGLQDNGSWGGPSRSLSGSGPTNEDWFMVGGGDGFVCRVDPNDPDLVYWESQDGNILHRNLRTGEAGGLQPKVLPGLQPYRFNWNTPFILSNHNSKILYTGGNYVFRSLKEGNDLRPISPEISRTKGGTATAISESPRNADILYAGTDDGNLWVTRDGGKEWTNVADKVGLPGPRWVASIEASRFVDGRAYAAFDGHRSDDDEPYVYITEDFGQTWKPLRANLPAGSTRVLREDIKNPDLLFLGTEFGAWASPNRGGAWTKINNNLPTVAVHEFAIHPTAGEIVVATHGRSLWVLDVTPLREMTAESLKDGKPHLYEPNTVTRWHRDLLHGPAMGSGSRHYAGSNPPPGAHIFYSLVKKAEKIELKVVNWDGKLVRELKAGNEPGLHHATWDLAPLGAPPRRRPGEPATPNGTYRVVLTVDGEEISQPLEIHADPTRPTAIVTDEPENPDREEEREREREEGDDRARAKEPVIR